MLLVKLLSLYIYEIAHTCIKFKLRERKSEHTLKIKGIFF